MDVDLRPIEGYPGYRISRFGVVESCWSRYRRPSVLTGTWLPLKPIVRGGYPTVNRTREGKKAAQRIHRLVLEAFVGPCPPGPVCCHNDRERANNRVENLRWDTPMANSDDTLRHGTRVVGTGCDAKLTEHEALKIRRLRAEGLTMGELASHFGVTPENIPGDRQGTVVAAPPWRPGRGRHSGLGEPDGARVSAGDDLMMSFFEYVARSQGIGLPDSVTMLAKLGISPTGPHEIDVMRLKKRLTLIRRFGDLA